MKDFINYLLYLAIHVEDPYAYPQAGLRLRGSSAPLAGAARSVAARSSADLIVCFVSLDLF